MEQENLTNAEGQQTAQPEQNQQQNSNEPTMAELVADMRNGDSAKSPAANEKKQKPENETDGNGVASQKNRQEGVKPGEQTQRESRGDRNWGKMTRLNSDLKRDNDKLNKRIAEFEAKYGNALDTSAMSDRDAAAATALHAVGKDNEERQIQEQQQRLQAEHASYYQSLIEDQIPESERDSFAENYYKYKDALSQNEPELMEFFTSSKFGPAILWGAFKELLNKPENYSAWSGLSTHAKRQFLSDIELRIIRGESDTQQQQQPKQQQQQQPTRDIIVPNGKPSRSGSSDTGDLVRSMKYGK